MSEARSRLVLTFPSIHDVLAAEDRLKDSGLVPDLLPLPRALTSDCGYCLTLADPSVLTSLPWGDLGAEAAYLQIRTDPDGHGRKEARYERIPLPH